MLKKTTQQIISIAMVLALVVVFAACGAKPVDDPSTEPETTTAETTVSETTTEELTTEETTVEETTEFVPKEWPPLATVKSVSGFLPVKESDYEELEKLVAWMWKFNSQVRDGFVFEYTEEDAIARALDLMHGRELFTLFFQGNTEEEEWDEMLETRGDYGLKRWNDDSDYPESHDVLPVDRIDWILQYIFNVKPDHMVHTDHWVCQDDYYYTNIPIEGSMWDTDYRTTVKRTNKDQTVDVSVAVWTFDDYGNDAWEWDNEINMYPQEAYQEDEYHFNITAGIREIDGVRQWTILRFEEKDVPTQD